MEVKRRKFLRHLLVSLAFVGSILSGYLFVYFNPKPLHLGLPFSQSNKNLYGIIIDAHNWNNTNDSVHLVALSTNNPDNYITFYAPTNCIVTRVNFEKMKNGGGSDTNNHVVKIGLSIGISYEIDLSIETFLPDSAIGNLQKQLTYVKWGQSLKAGQKVITLVSNHSAAHICYSVKTPKGRKHPLDFMSDTNKLEFNNLSVNP